MKIFLSALEASPEFEHIDTKIDGYMYNLMSYFYIKGKEYYKPIIRKSKEILIDSGAHSFQSGKRVDWEEYTKEYANWIYRVDEDKILGYFEMDIDPAGYPLVYVERLRKILNRQSNKIIPVWHKNRGIEEFKRMCKNPNNINNIVAITGFKNEDIRDHQYIYFYNYAKACGVDIHCLGMTRRGILDKVPFDYVDSSSWKQDVLFGSVGDIKLGKEYTRANRAEALYYSYLKGMKMQKEYYYKYRKK